MARTRSTADRAGTERNVLRALAEAPRRHVVEFAEGLDADPVAVDRVCFELQRRECVRARGASTHDGAREASSAVVGARRRPNALSIPTDSFHRGPVRF